MHARDHRGDPGGQEGAARLPGRPPRERAELARIADRPQGPWPGRFPRACRRRRGSGVLEGARRGLPRNPPPAVLVPQDRERDQPLPESHAAGRELRPARCPSRRNPGRRAPRHRNLPGEIRRQICPRGDLPDQGHRGATGILRLPGRALGSPAHLEPDRERVRHGPPSHGAHQGGPVAEDREADGLHPGQGGRKDLAQAERYNSVAPPHRGRQIHRRCRPVRCHPKPGGVAKVVGIPVRRPPGS
jgi:hypothetical protein